MEVEADGSAAEAADSEVAANSRRVPASQVNRVNPRLGDTGAPSIRICHKVNGRGVLYITAGAVLLIFVQSRLRVHGGIFSPQSNLKISNNETGTSSAKNSMTKLM